MKYRKKPVVIEAMRFDDNPNALIKLQEFMHSDLRVSYKNPEKPVFKIEAGEIVMEASVGDYIIKIKGVNGEYYLFTPCEPDIFYKTYEEVL